MAFRGRRAKGADNHAVHQWANKIGTEKRNGNLFFERDTIYSYGHHFPMARHIDDNTVVMTTRTYSPTTSGHMSAVRSAISHKNIIWCRDLPTGKKEFKATDKSTHDRNIQGWIEQVKDELEKMAKARKPEIYVQNIAGIRGQANRYIEFFKVKLKAEQKKLLFAYDLNPFTKAIKKRIASEKKKAEALTKKGKELHPEWLEAWRTFNESEFAKELTREERGAIESVELSDGAGGKDWNIVRLRTDGEDVYTSKGIKIPKDVAHRYYKKYLAVVAAGGCNNTCDYKMLEYSVNIMSADRLVVGCHDISRGEIDYIATKLGWTSVDTTKLVKDEKNLGKRFM